MYLNLLRLVILLLIFSFSESFSQTKYYTPSQVSQDLDYLNKYLKKWQPSYYNYTSKAEMDNTYSLLKESNKTDISAQKLKILVTKAINKVGCGHMWVEGVKGIQILDSIKSVPFDPYILENKIYVRRYLVSDTLLKNGDEIISINGITADSLIKTTSELLLTDANNFTYKTYWLEHLFYGFFYQIYGVSEDLEIEVKSKNELSRKVIIPSIYRNKTNIRYYRNVPDSSDIVLAGKGINLLKLKNIESTALIDFENFNGKHQRSTYKKIFKYLNNNKVENLVIDLRDNGGGNVFKGYNFLKYLINNTFFGFNISRKPNLTFMNPKFKSGFFERITPILFMANPFQYPNKNGWNHFFPFMKKLKNHFDNNIYVITNGQTFSMASSVATLLKYKRNAKIIGEETGGSEYATRAMATGKIKLPNSGIKVNFNVYQYKLNGIDKDSGHGLLPDYPIQYSVEDRFSKRDLELEKISELIKTKN